MAEVKKRTQDPIRATGSVVATETRKLKELTERHNKLGTAREKVSQLMRQQGEILEQAKARHAKAMRGEPLDEPGEGAES